MKVRLLKLSLRKISPKGKFCYIRDRDLVCMWVCGMPVPPRKRRSAAGHPRPHVVNDVNMGNSLEIIVGVHIWSSGRQESHSGEMERERKREELHFCDFCKRGEKATGGKKAQRSRNLTRFISARLDLSSLTNSNLFDRPSSFLS